VDRIRFPPKGDSQKQGKLGLDAGAPDVAAILVYAQVREAGRRVKIAAAFCEPNSIHLA